MPRAIARLGTHASLAILFACLTAIAACSDDALEAQPKHYVGIGVELTMEAAGARVVRILPGSDATRAGLAPDDIILEVGGVSTRGLNLAEVVAALRGDPETTVDVLVRSASGERELALTRRALQNP